ncbi:MAG: hypothetical protein QE263_04930 [Vampirovibrionales bacterium]|nr:hypothetical protein [Vampirovibrionales bacterium]
MNFLSTHWILSLHLASLAVMTGVIIYVQVVHYPLFALVGNEAFLDYHHAHARLTTWVVAPAMGIELITALILYVLRPPDISIVSLGFNLALVAVAWLSTAFIQVPLHNQLEIVAVENRLLLINTLVATNWIRTIVWSLRGLGWTMWLTSTFKRNLLFLTLLTLSFFFLAEASVPTWATPIANNSKEWPWNNLQSLAEKPCPYRLGLKKQPTIILVSFHPKEQKIVNTWLDALESKTPVIEVPVLEPRWLKVRAQATGFMKSQVNKKYHEFVCPLYQPHAVVTNQLKLPKNPSGVYVFLADSSGKILSEDRGIYSPEKLKQLLR